MGPTLEDGLRALVEATEQARHVVIALDGRYLRAIAAAEALPANAPGADKSWVARADAAFRSHYAAATRA
jgi:hypothetical protein